MERSDCSKLLDAEIRATGRSAATTLLENYCLAFGDEEGCRVGKLDKILILIIIISYSAVVTSKQKLRYSSWMTADESAAAC